jgi:hypothetical protein
MSWWVWVWIGGIGVLALAALWAIVLFTPSIRRD